MNQNKGVIVSFYCTPEAHRKLRRIRRGQRSAVINAALDVFLAPDGQDVRVVSSAEQVEQLSREEAIRKTKALLLGR